MNRFATLPGRVVTFIYARDVLFTVYERPRWQFWRSRYGVRRFEEHRPMTEREKEREKNRQRSIIAERLAAPGVHDRAMTDLERRLAEICMSAVRNLPSFLADPARLNLFWTLRRAGASYEEIEAITGRADDG